MPRKPMLKGDAERRDLMRVGMRVELEQINIAPSCEAFHRCPHCYLDPCNCKGQRRRHATYSAADYMPYQLSEDDLIACIDILRQR